MAAAREQMLCTMCFNSFSLNSRRPKLLPCNHVMCEKCINQVSKSVQRGFACPECHVTHPLGKFPTHREIVEQLEEIQKKKTERKEMIRRASMMSGERPEAAEGLGQGSLDEVKEEMSGSREEDAREEAGKRGASEERKEEGSADYRSSNGVPNQASHSNGGSRSKSGRHSSSQSNNDDRKMCSMHKKRFIMICKDHNVLVCHECWKSNHAFCNTNDFWDEIQNRKQSVVDGIQKHETTLKTYRDEVEHAFQVYCTKTKDTLDDIRQCKQMWVTEVMSFFERVQSAIEKKLEQEEERKTNFDENVKRLLGRYRDSKQKARPLGENDIHVILDLERETQELNREADTARANTGSFENRKFVPKQRGTLLADSRRRVADEMGALGVIRVDVVGAPDAGANGPVGGAGPEGGGGPRGGGGPGSGEGGPAAGMNGQEAVNGGERRTVKLYPNPAALNKQHGSPGAGATSLPAAVRRPSGAPGAFAAPGGAGRGLPTGPMYDEPRATPSAAPSRLPRPVEYVLPPEYAPPPAQVVAALGGNMPAALHYAQPKNPPPYQP